MRTNKTKIIFFAETHGILDELKIQEKIISKLKPTRYVYELLEEGKITSEKGFKKFLDNKNSKRFSVISSYGELKPTVRLAKKYHLPMVGCDVKNMYRTKRNFLSDINTNEEEIMRKREERQAKVIKESLNCYGFPIFVSVGAFHLRKNSLIFKKIKSNFIIVYPLIDKKELHNLPENFNIKKAKNITYVIEAK
ncbi:MAG: hypothetical protein AABY07_07720 [Nanoarchaeota archaeon]